jgi:MtN3 and saliva related transmembrane protein
VIQTAAAYLEIAQPSPAVTALGLIAAALTTLSFVPQVLRVLRNRSGRDVSFTWIISFSAGVLFWLIYGLLLNALPIILANIVTLALTLTLLVLKLRFRPRSNV